MFDEIKTFTIEQIEQRSAELLKELDTADETRIAEIDKELDAIKERKAVIEAEIETRKNDIKDVLKGAGKVVGKGEEDKMPKVDEIRNSKEYIEAFAKYIKTGKADECRALLTENVEKGTVPVPELVQNRVQAAWENDEIWNRVAKTYVRGNLKVGFEISATDADIHTEGDMTGPAEEVLTLGIVTMVPDMIKKWITVSDEVLALGAEDFLAYIYDELTYKIIQKAADLVVYRIQNAPTVSDADNVGVPSITGGVTPQNILAAIAALSDNAKNRVFIASGSTIAAVRSAALGANYAYDPFFGLTVIQKDGVAGAIVGDLAGVQANMPEGETIKFKFDDLSLAEHDMVKIVGRLYAAIRVVTPGMFANITAA